jgi:hypothetical protein
MPEEKKEAVLAADEELLKDEKLEEKLDEIADEKEEDEAVAESPYAEELKRINEEKQALVDKNDADARERERQVQIKDAALLKEKLEKKDIVERLKDETKNEVLDEWERRMDNREARKLVTGMTEDQTAQKVILHHFEKLPKELRTGTVEGDLETAYALANRKRVRSLLDAERAEDENDNESLRSMSSGGGMSSNPTFKGTTSPAARAAANLASIYAGGDKDRAKKLAEKTKRYI